MFILTTRHPSQIHQRVLGQLIQHQAGANQGTSRMRRPFARFKYLPQRRPSTLQIKCMAPPNVMATVALGLFHSDRCQHDSQFGQGIMLGNTRKQSHARLRAPDKRPQDMHWTSVRTLLTPAGAHQSTALLPILSPLELEHVFFAHFQALCQVVQDETHRIQTIQENWTTKTLSVSPHVGAGAATQTQAHSHSLSIQTHTGA